MQRFHAEARDWERWSINQINLASALNTFSERNSDGGARAEAIAELRAALRVVDRSSDADTWAALQTNLGVALTFEGLAGNDAALEEALRALHLALEVDDRRTRPMDWATVQNSLGVAYRAQAFRGDLAALQPAMRAFENAREVWTPQVHPRGWVKATLNIAIVLAMRAQLGDRQAGLRARALAQEVEAKAAEVGDAVSLRTAQSLLIDLRQIAARP